MSKIKDYAMTIDEIIEAGEDFVVSFQKAANTAGIILNAVKELKELFYTGSPALPDSKETKAVTEQTSSPAPAKENPDKEEQHVYTFTEVRGIMAGLSSQGKKSEAKALIEKFGATRLSDVKEEDYASLVHEAQVIANG